MTRLQLTKEDIRDKLLRPREDTIIFHLLNRAQYVSNPDVYTPGKSGFQNRPEESLFDIMLLKQERLFYSLGRYSAPGEIPLNSISVLGKVERDFDRPNQGIILYSPGSVSVGEDLMSAYIQFVQHDLCRSGDDKFNEGSCAEHDANAFLSIMSRAHIAGCFMGERKYLDEEEKMTYLAQNEMREDIFQAITIREVEEKNLMRIGKRVDFCQRAEDPNIRRIVDKSVIMDFFDNAVMKYTKWCEVEYIMQRVLGQNK